MSVAIAREALRLHNKHLQTALVACVSRRDKACAFALVDGIDQEVCRLEEHQQPLKTIFAWALDLGDSEVIRRLLRAIPSPLNRQLCGVHQEDETA